MGSQVLKNPVISFMLAVVMLFSLIAPVNASAASKVSKKWSYTLKGEPLFQPISQKDTSLFVVNYQIINSVYNADIMTFDSKGKKKNAWKLKGASQSRDSLFLGGTATSPVIYNVNTEKGIVYAYSQKGKKLWKKSLNTAIRSSKIDPNGNILLATEKKLYRYTAKGKRTLTITLPTRITSDGSTYSYGLDFFTLLKNGSLYFVRPNFGYGDEKDLNKLIKYDSKGKKTEKSVIPTGDLKNFTSMDIFYVDEKTNTIYIKAYFQDKKDPNNYEDDVYSGKVYSLNSKLNVLWSKNISLGSINYVDKYNKYLHVYTGDHYYMFSEKGKLKSYEVPKSVQSSYYSDVHRLAATGELYVRTETSLIRYDSNGKKRWEKTLTETGTFAEFKKQAVIAGQNYISAYTKDQKLNWKYPNVKGSFVRNVTANEKASTLYVESVIVNQKDYSKKTIIKALKQK